MASDSPPPAGVGATDVEPTLTAAQVTLQGWQGPLPPPGALESFERIVPGSGAKIIQEFQDEAHHRRSLEKVQAAQIGRETLLGQVLALAFSMGALGATTFAIHEHQQWAAAILGGGVIVGGIVAFIKGRGGQ